MSVRNIHSVHAELNLVEILDENGASWFVTRTLYDKLIADGDEVVARRFPIVRPSAVTRPWISLADAAQQLCKHVSVEFNEAKLRVWRAKEAGKFTSSGSKRALRIEPTSFDSWCMQQQSAYLDSLD